MAVLSNLSCEKMINLFCRNDKLQKDFAGIRYVFLEKRAKLERDRKLNLKHIEGKVLKDLAQQLNERLELLKLISGNVGKEFIITQGKLQDIQVQIEYQDDLLSDIENENRIMEKNVNGKLHEIRVNFLKKFVQLNDAKEKHMEAEQTLMELRLTGENLEKELRQKKLQLRRTKNGVKKLKAKSWVPHNNDKIIREHTEMTKKLYEISQHVQCLIYEVNVTRDELEVSRETIKRRLSVVKDFNEWNKEALIKTKFGLEKFIKDNSKDSQTDLLINEMKGKIPIDC